MFRFSVLVGISLLVYGASSKPRSTWGEVGDTAVQVTLMSEGQDKLPLGLKEVEPPQDMDVADFDIDPSMLIWKAVMESRRRAIQESRTHVMLAKDHGARYHHAEAQLAQALQPDDAPLPPADPEPGMRYHQAEPDMDEVYHGFPDPAGPADRWVAEDRDPMTQEHGAEDWRGSYDRAELDLDEIYHGDMGQSQVETQLEPAQDDSAVPRQKERSLPEEDLDDLYHKY
ncbi:uncharacterized protein si:ch211-217g15.3 [Clupea harengus]|uniref:Uncharacterized protein si:ch211-217g15.3 n=1 Tax=Clupea harengus TaxID=7950 RepID=A0A6P8G5L8_CLUHA|nr:uncharacterized protein si:ch211-217g15.3 [Clupea harengus]